MNFIREIILEFDSSIFDALDLEIPTDNFQEFRINQVLHYSSDSFAGVFDIRFSGHKEEKSELSKHPQVLFFQEMFTSEGVLTALIRVKLDLSSFKTLANFQVFIKPPISFVDGKLSVCLFGNQEGLREVFSELKEKSIKFTVAKVGTVDLQRNKGSTLSYLTTKQEKVIRYASEHGYFEIPRNISTKTIADEFGITPAAVLEHLRKATRKIFELIFENA
ncbi:MAG: helix-turn-helix domain-containing protein [Promethearchaeota archaeon]